MGLFDIFKSSKKENHNPISNSIGQFFYSEFDGTKNFKGIINSTIDKNIEILFPINESEISKYQFDYFKKIETNWISIRQKLKIFNSQIDFENYKVVHILIPDKKHEHYDMGAEIVFQNKENFISVILNDINIDEIIEN
ncbi:hypothetical protein [Kaistella sp.]|uniref:hypothetical protein n=1 Tax=Kaistella sp. TaxID=2782235 RepID=UPI003C5730D8